MNNFTELDIIEYYKTHTSENTKKYFNIKYSKSLLEILRKNNIPARSMRESKVWQFLNDKNIIINEQELIDYYKNHSAVKTIENFNITRSILYWFLDKNNIKKHTITES